MRRIWRSPNVREFLGELAPEEQEAFHEHELLIYRDPSADELTRFRLPGGDLAYYVYYGPLFELIYRLDPTIDLVPGLMIEPSQAEDVLMILTARLADDEAA